LSVLPFKSIEAEKFQILFLDLLISTSLIVNSTSLLINVLELSIFKVLDFILVLKFLLS